MLAAVLGITGGDPRGMNIVEQQKTLPEDEIRETADSDFWGIYIQWAFFFPESIALQTLSSFLLNAIESINK